MQGFQSAGGQQAFVIINTISPLILGEIQCLIGIIEYGGGEVIFRDSGETDADSDLAYQRKGMGGHRGTEPLQCQLCHCKTHRLKHHHKLFTTKAEQQVAATKAVLHFLCKTQQYLVPHHMAVFIIHPLEKIHINHREPGIRRDGCLALVAIFQLLQCVLFFLFLCAQHLIQAHIKGASIKQPGERIPLTLGEQCKQVLVNFQQQAQLALQFVRARCLSIQHQLQQSNHLARIAQGTQ